MNKAGKILLSLSGLAAITFGIYKGVSKHPPKYSLEWIKKLPDKDWKKEK